MKLISTLKGTIKIHRPYDKRSTLSSGRLTFTTLKLSLLLILASAFYANAAVYSQNVTLSVKNMPLEQVFNLIKKQTGYTFVYATSSIKKSTPLTLSVRNETLSKTLELCLDERLYAFNIIDNVVVIKDNKEEAINTSANTMVSLTQQQHSAFSAQNDIPSPPPVEIKGRVMDENKNPMENVSVVVKGAKTGAYTNKSGQFSIEVRDEEVILVFSHVGYLNAEKKANKNATLIVQMEPDKDNAMSDVVVTGYQVLKKYEMTGSTAKVKMEDIRVAGMTTVDQMLQGQVPGVSVMMTDGTVGAAPKVRIRGTSTLIGNREPLWVVDGIIREDPVPNAASLSEQLTSDDVASRTAGMNLLGNSISGLSPDDIEDITFLKDASATAIYGSRAANGVIVISTKKGKIGSPRTNVRGDFSLTPRYTYNDVPMMNSAERIDLSKELIDNGITYPSMPLNVGYEGLYIQLMNKEISSEEFARRARQMAATNTDWYEVLFQNALSQSYAVNVSGGSSLATYYASASYGETNNTAKENWLKRFTAMAKTDLRLSKAINAGMSVSASTIKNSGYYSAINPSQYALMTSRTIRADEFYIKSQASVYPASGAELKSDLLYNIQNEINHTSNTGSNNAIVFQAYLNLNITQGLKWNTIFALNHTSINSERWADEYSYAVSQVRKANYGELPKGSDYEKASDLPYGGIINYDPSTTKNYTLRNALTYLKTFGKSRQHNFNIVFGNEIRSTESKGHSTKDYGYFPDRGERISYDYGTQGRIPTSKGKHYAIRTNKLENFLSFFGSASYTYKEKLSFSLNGRNDASNRFGQYSKNKFNPIWSTGIRWDVLKEKWMESVKIIDGLAPRSSFGYQGNIVQNVSPELIAKYPETLYSPETGEAYLEIRSLPFPDLDWEKTRSINTGVDLAMFKGRVSVTLDFYYKKAEQVITQRNVPQEYGTSNMYINGSDIINKGFDIMVKVTPVKTQNWKWDLIFNTGKNYNEVKNVKTTSKLSDYLKGSALVEGQDANSFYSFIYTGLSHEYGAPTFRYVDVDENHKADSGLLMNSKNNPFNYLASSGVTEPTLSGGLTSRLTYKNFSLNASFNIQLGNYKRLNPLIMLRADGALLSPMPQENAREELVNRWRKPGDEQYTNIPALVNENPNIAIAGRFPVSTGATSLDGIGLYRNSLYNYSDYRVASASHIRCNNVSFAYTFNPKALQRKLGNWISGLTLSGSATNLFVIASKKLDGQDPEILSMSATSVTPGLPRPRVYSFSLSLGL